MGKKTAKRRRPRPPRRHPLRDRLRARALELVAQAEASGTIDAGEAAEARQAIGIGGIMALIQMIMAIWELIQSWLDENR